MILCAHGKPRAACSICGEVAARDVTRGDVVVDVDLPPWLHGVQYIGELQHVLVTVLVPVRDAYGGVVGQPVQFATTPEQLRAMQTAFGKLLERIDQTRAIVDAPATERRDVDDDVIDVD